MLTLASASPRRRELLARIGVPLEIRAADVDERELSGEPPDVYVARIARAKAAAVTGAWVLAADTTVTIDGAILAKAESPEEATAMLRRLSGRTHRVLTAFVLRGAVEHGDVATHEQVVASEVDFVTLDDATLAAYVASDEWRGKAGAYAIQGIAAAFVREVRGSVTNIVGLPLAEVVEALRALGGPAPRFAAGAPA